jgi:uncharacterized protein related to proFAR isomerase
MIKKIFVVSFLASIAITFVQCNETTKKTTIEEKVVVMEQKQRNLVGGWKSIEITDTVKELASYVVTQENIESPIKELSNAASQVVSGKNYRFQMLLENGETWETQVYVNINKERSITSLKKITN